MSVSGKLFSLSTSLCRTIVRSKFTLPSNLISTKEINSRRQNFTTHIIDQFKETRSLNKIIVLFPSAPQQYMSYHVPYVYRQDSTFLYFTGLTEPNSALLFELDYSNSSEPDSKWTLFVEERGQKDTLWHGPTLGVNGARDTTGIANCEAINSLGPILTDLLDERIKSSTYFFCDPEHPNQTVKQQIMAIFGESIYRTMRNPNLLVEQLRLFKSTSEIQMIKQACDITSAALIETMKSSWPGIVESQMWGRLEYESKWRGAPLAYPPVIAGADRANTIHYIRNDNVIRDGDMVLIDAGSDFYGYVSDVTRVWPINGEFSPAQRTLYDIVLHVQEKCISAISPESSLARLYVLMMEEFARCLLNENILQRRGVAEYLDRACPHHIGHYLGLDVHDTPTISTYRFLQPGMVFPIEPGLYFAKDSNFVPPEFRGLCVRVEDDVTINDDGSARILSDLCPKSRSDIEALVRMSSSQSHSTSSNLS